jgi:Flp pilus assembly protein protease CpaA
MYEIIFLILLGFVWISFASIQDLRKREVADWLNYSLIIFAIGFRFFYCLFESKGWAFFYQGLIGLGIFFAIGNLLYYGRFFAGGDAKLMISLGSVFPLSVSFFENLNYFFTFFLIFLLVGAIYGLLWSFFLAFFRFKEFKSEFLRQLNKNKKILTFVWTIAILLVIFGVFFNFLLFLMGVMFLIIIYFFFFSKAVEEVCMIKSVKTKELTEGDWLYKNIKVGKKTIESKWDGLTQREINFLKKHKKNVLIKQGIPFVPVFWISFLIWVFLNF